MHHNISKDDDVDGKNNDADENHCSLFEEGEIDSNL
jgi:hypothetical protein